MRHLGFVRNELQGLQAAPFVRPVAERLLRASAARAPGVRFACTVYWASWYYTNAAPCSTALQHVCILNASLRLRAQPSRSRVAMMYASCLTLHAFCSMLHNAWCDMRRAASCTLSPGAFIACFHVDLDGRGAGHNLDLGASSSRGGIQPPDCQWRAQGNTFQHRFQAVLDSFGGSSPCCCPRSLPWGRFAS